MCADNTTPKSNERGEESSVNRTALGFVQEQVKRLTDRVDRNTEIIIRSEQVKDRLTAVELQVNKLCNRITVGLWGMVVTLITGISALIVAIWHIIQWIQELINHTVIAA
ncbi:hypothetical protein [uncultured Paraglaciecola sp.]|uniref:hypothetical protein n=1 Tax=uncultured Paraglaciecola sp. TaxID=1765024 RepID=UPI002601C1A7|nr:hypothetical protein [uncultured Paraglaciecola sp.]